MIRGSEGEGVRPKVTSSSAFATAYRKRADALTLIGLLLCFFLMGCQPGVETEANVTFYHWETNLSPSPTARNLLDSFACDRLYVKVFDLSWTDVSPQISARVSFGDTTGLPQLVPVIFITNEVLLRAKPSELGKLAERTLNALNATFPTGYPELQIDCDWTARTQVQYFAFLNEVRNRLANTIMLTCTVRLHQYRDRDAQGIPPVDRATLMAYNTGDLDDWQTENSIYDSTIVKAYLTDQPAYPLDLDLAVAAYDWAAVYRRGELAYLINEPDLVALADTSRFAVYPQAETPRYYVKQSTYLNGIYLYAGDEIRREIVPPGTIAAQTRLLQRYVKSFTGQRIMVFRLKSRLWQE